jgi:hypothetical protein
LSGARLNHVTLTHVFLSERNLTHPQLDYNAEPNFQPCIKVSVFFRKIDSVSYETFFGHWQSVHADLAVATQAFRDSIQRYVQVSQTK